MEKNVTAPHHVVLYTVLGFAVHATWLKLLCPSIPQLAALTVLYVLGTALVVWEYRTNHTYPSIAVSVFILGGVCCCVLGSIMMGIATLVYSLS